MHLREAWVFQSLIPRLHITRITIARRITGLQHLHDGIMAVGVSATACKHTPIGIAAHIVVLPARFVGVVQTHGDVLVGRFCVQDGLDGVVFPRGVDIHPVVLLRIVRYGVVGIAHTLSVTTMSALEGVEINPLSLAPPFCRGIAPTRMIGHQVVLVYRLDSRCQRLPNLRLDVALNVATHKPDDVGLVLITVGKERTVFLRVVHTQQTCLDQSAPNAYHSNIDTVLSRHIDDIVHVVPIAVDALAVNVLEVPPIHVRHLSIDVDSRHTVDGLHLYHVIARFGTRLQIPLGLSPV